MAARSVVNDMHARAEPRRGGRPAVAAAGGERGRGARRRAARQRQLRVRRREALRRAARPRGLCQGLPGGEERTTQLRNTFIYTIIQFIFNTYQLFYLNRLYNCQNNKIKIIKL